MENHVELILSDRPLLYRKMDPLNLAEILLERVPSLHRSRATQIIDNGHHIPAVEPIAREMISDEAGAACNEDLHDFIPLAQTPLSSWITVSSLNQILLAFTLWKLRSGGVTS